MASGFANIIVGLKKKINIKLWCIGCLLIISNAANGQNLESLKDSLRVDGDISLRNVFYTMSGIENRRSPFSYVLSSNISISKGDFNLPFSFTYSEQDRGFSQPFNQFGLTPSYKWAKAYLGYNSLNWNEFVLSGAQFLGVGVELNPGKLRVGAMYGRFRRETPLDSVGFVSNRNGIPSYDQRGFGVKLGVGSETSFVDLTVFRGNDRVNEFSPIKKDSLTHIFPAENTALGISSGLAVGSFGNFKLDCGLSLYNRDKTAPVSESDATENGLAILNSIHPLRLSTSVYYGIKSSFNFRVKNHNFDIHSSYVNPDYKAMGIYYMDNDIFLYGMNHGFNAWKSKINVNYGINRISDNLEGKKQATTIRLQPIVNLSIDPSQHWGVQASWNNFYTRQRDGNIALSDSFRINQSNPGLTITPHFQWGDTVQYNSVFLMFTQMQMIDNNPLTSMNSEYTATVYGASYSASNSPKNIGYSVGVNFTRNQNVLVDERALGINLGVNKSAKEGKLNASSNLAFQTSNLSNTISLGVNGNYALKHKQNIDFGINLLRNIAKGANANNFNELTFTISYFKNFNYVHRRKR